MQVLTIVKILLFLTVIGLFIWTFIGPKKANNKNHYDNGTFKYGKYMIYLLTFEVALIVIFTYV
ncbi:hypothetical protein [Metabacillus malikii]|uniref:Heme/copper-type cytochrome/quinol oxidase subunit 2 n=1 Tax=Metabacillus malikii TaxID=1504265 RepID=A0ABT9Z9X7_9BACI|nr:hypothetical protein [Metabacillus malikii]MDQ0229051.1 heme/copper-type cytochrome/quinol oxidase subunit 2 [Metabacillus malikii]